MVGKCGAVKMFGDTVTNHNLILEEIKRRLISGIACYHSVQNLLSSRLLSKDVKIKIYNALVLPVVMYEYETWSVTLREEHILRVFENRVLRRIFGPKRVEMTGGWRGLHNSYFAPSIIRTVKSRRVRWVGHVARTGRRGRHVGYWWESQTERDH
jgi:hypothetical protein